MEWGGVKTDDAGNSVYYDGFGNINYATDNQGNAVATGSIAGNAILSQLAGLLNYGVRTAIDSRGRDAEIQRQLQLARAGVSLGNVGSLNLGGLMPILLLAGAGFVAYKLIKG